jgi:dUTP pyrophosphatase
MDNIINVFIRMGEGGTLPEYISINAAGCDLYATEDMALTPGETKLMPLNFVMAMGKDIEAQIRPRSGLSLKTDLRISNSPGTIDSDYRNVVGVILQNTYNIACLPYRIAENPNLLNELNDKYSAVELGEYLKTIKGVQIFRQNDHEIHNMSKILREIIYIDNSGYPLGTIFIKKGERIAQMVFSEYKRANFIHHLSPESIGEDRGGGFGHSG